MVSDVDTTPPDAPTIGSIYDNVGSQTGELQPGDVTDDTTPTLESQLKRARRLRSHDRGQKIGEVTAALMATGHSRRTVNWRKGSTALPYVRPDAAGNASELSQPWELEIDITPPTSRVQTAMAQVSAKSTTTRDNTGPILSGGSTDDTKPTLSRQG
ncbi:Uncharacterised protein [Serratia fonticola]|uniref:Uncharacterized protein n=1 Tax=Serratia fonticola TaxID=47917 RepID=A0A4U9UT63_SERFO|nr:Uncharacterised protein [Serratia fonticola]